MTTDRGGETAAIDLWVKLDADHWAARFRGAGWRIVNAIYVPADVLRDAAAEADAAPAMRDALEKAVADINTRMGPPSMATHGKRLLSIEWPS